MSEGVAGDGVLSRCRAYRVSHASEPIRSVGISIVSIVSTVPTYTNTEPINSLDEESRADMEAAADRERAHLPLFPKGGAAASSETVRSRGNSEIKIVGKKSSSPL